ncbi:MAG: threo-3-hydroxy-L-aspartate ammonia-lyase [Castellaniella sp.]
MDLPDYDDIVAAAQRLRGVAHRTPVLQSRSLNERLGSQVFFKCENLQRIGAFKFRGAFNALSQLSDEQRRAGVVAYSSGNHAQAVAMSARLLGVQAVIIMPSDAPRSKLEATKGYGARVVEYDRFNEDREVIARRWQDEHGTTLVPPFDHPDIIAGQGTAVKELLEDAGPLDALFVPLGGGGLLSGSLLAAHHLAPDCAVYGVEPEAGDDGRQSLQRGKRVRIAVPESIADGALTRELGALTFAIIRRHVRDILVVPDKALIEAMRFFAERMKIVVEPTACLGMAAVFAQGPALAGKRVGVVLSGGNVDLAAYAGWLADQ